MIFRVVNEMRMPKVKDLWDECFEKKGTPFFEFYFNEYCGKDNTVIGGFDENDNLLTMLHLNPYMLKIHNENILTPYIVGVATTKNARGKKIMGELLQTAFTMLRSQNFPFVFLMPVAEKIYTPYGFSFIDFRPAYDLEKIHQDKNYTFEKIIPSQEILAPLYEKFTHDCNTVVRTDFQWHKLLKDIEVEKTKCELIIKNGKTCGYLFIENSGKILEYINLDADITQEKSLPFMMARCIDVRAALTKLNVQNCPDCNFTLLIGDDFLEDNNHLLKVAVQDEKLNFTSTTETEDFAMDIEIFTQLYFGVKNVLDFVEEGKIVVNNPLKLAALSRLFPKCQTYINEYF